MTATLVKFPEVNLADIPASLRRLAAKIEAGEPAASFAYVIDTGDGIELGMLGSMGVPGPEAYLLFGCAMRKFESE